MPTACRPNDLAGEDALLDFDLCAEDVFNSHIARQGLGLIASRRRDDRDGMSRLLMRLHERTRLGVDLSGEVFHENLFANLFEHRLREPAVDRGRRRHQGREAGPPERKGKRAIERRAELLRTHPAGDESFAYERSC